jgi:hypothetical protein
MLHAEWDLQKNIAGIVPGLIFFFISRIQKPTIMPRQKSSIKPQ